MWIAHVARIWAGGTKLNEIIQASDPCEGNQWQKFEISRMPYIQSWRKCRIILAGALDVLWIDGLKVEGSSHEEPLKIFANVVDNSFAMVGEIAIVYSAPCRL